MSEESKLIIYATADGRTELQLRVQDGSVWLSQLEIAELFGTSVPNVNIHIKNVLEDGELTEAATIKDFLIVRLEGAREVQRAVKIYSLEMVLSIGYRVKGPRGVQFRQWATENLAEYLVKGFVMNDERLKNPGGWDYFDELLARIREIRASEKRFYQKVRDLFALSTDYHDDEQAASRFFAETQNKMLFAVTRHTAAEIVVKRADPQQPNMNLRAWSGPRVRKADVIVAKNYLSADEIDTLNRLVVLFLEQAELRVKERKQLTLDYWRSNVDRTLAFNDFAILKNAGAVSHSSLRAIRHQPPHRRSPRRRPGGHRRAGSSGKKAAQKAPEERRSVTAARPPQTSAAIAVRTFFLTQTEEKLRREQATIKEQANRIQNEVGKKVRQTIRELGGTMPENLPVAGDERAGLEGQRPGLIPALGNAQGPCGVQSRGLKARPKLAGGRGADGAGLQPSSPLARIPRPTLVPRFGLGWYGAGLWPFDADDIKKVRQTIRELGGTMPKGMRPQPEGVRPQPKGMRTQPKGVRPQPKGVRPQPKGVRPQPKGVRLQPEGVRPQPEGVRTQPEGVRPQPEGVRPQPEGVRPQPLGKCHLSEKRGHQPEKKRLRDEQKGTK